MPDPQATQAKSSLQLTTPLGADALLLQSLDGTETLSAPFHFQLVAQAKTADTDLAALVGETASVTLIDGNGRQRFIHGHVTRATRDGTTCTLELRPWLWLLTLSGGCRIFQNKTTPEIVKQVFTDAGHTDFRDALTGTYTALDYCVQYRETDYDFVCRLLENTGIAWFLEFTADAHTLVLVDDASSHPACPNAASLPFQPLGPRSGWLEEDRIEGLTSERQVTSTRYQADDYSFETPSTELKVTQGDSGPMVYEYPGGYTARDAGEAAARRRLEAFEADAERISGTSTVRFLTAGHTFTLTGHPTQALNASYLLRHVHHQAAANEYGNRFDAQPADTPFRPPRQTPRPVIPGSQTALVVGSEGHEVWTDQYGRIKVQFHWDQVGQKNENSSCWVRVSQRWAGTSWGAFALPRIGQEVVVSFLDGDPDRPIVTGCVYNGDNPVPYALPDEQTKTTLKSNTSVGGNGFNELRFEDKQDSEEVYLHAQKDMTVVIVNDRTQTINHDDTATIKNNRTLTISEGNETLTVTKGTRKIEVSEGNETHTNGANFDHKVAGNLTLTVDGNITIKASGSIMIDAGGSLTLKSGTNLTATGGTSLTATAGTALTLTGGTTMEIKGSAAGTVDGGGMLTVKGGLVKIN
jgi:type VI secretion system secreted protein VgrG